MNAGRAITAAMRAERIAQLERMLEVLPPPTADVLRAHLWWGHPLRPHLVQRWGVHRFSCPSRYAGQCTCTLLAPVTTVCV